MAKEPLIRAAIEEADEKELSTIIAFPERPGHDEKNRVGVVLASELADKVVRISGNRSDAKLKFDHKNSIVEECISRYLFENRKKWSLTADELRAIGYSEKARPSNGATGK